MRSRMTALVMVCCALMMLSPRVAQAQTVQYAGPGYWDITVAYPQYASIAGYWSNSTDPIYYRAFFGNTQVSRNNGDYLTFNFSGQRVTYWYTRSLNRGYFEVTIDGNYITTMSACSPGAAVVSQVGVTFTTPWAGTHVVKVKNVGWDPNCSDPTNRGIIDVDGFSVDVGTYSSQGFESYGYDDNETDSGGLVFRYSPSYNSNEWWLLNVSGAYNSTIHTQDTLNTFLRFTTTGESLDYIFSQASNRGPVEVLIDGGAKYGPFIINQYNASLARQRDRAFSNLNVSLNSGVTIDTHIIHIRPRNTGGLIDIDRLDVSSKTQYPPIFNTIKVGNYTNYGARANISTGDPVIRDNPNVSNNGSYMRVFVQKHTANGSGIEGFAEIGHEKSLSLGNRVIWVFRRPSDGYLFSGALNTAAPVVGSTHAYKVQREFSNTYALYYDGVFAAQFNVGFDAMDTFGAGGETFTSSHGMGSAMISSIQPLSTSYNWANACPNIPFRTMQLYTIIDNGTCTSFTVAGNN